MKSVCTSVQRYSLASSACLCLATVRPGAAMSTGSPRTQTACVIPGWPSPSPATVSSAISVLRVPFTRSAVALESRRVDAASPRGGSDYYYYYYYLVPLRKRGGPFPPHLFIGSRRKLRRDRGGGQKKKKQPRRAAMRQTGRRCQSREQGGEKCVSPSPRSNPPTPPKNENARGEKHRVASRTHQLEGGRAGVLRPEKRSARLVNY